MANLTYKETTFTVVSINSTSYKGSGELNHIPFLASKEFPLIPLPIKEAVTRYTLGTFTCIKENGFPLIPLPIKEAVSHGQCVSKTRMVSINSTSYKGSGLSDVRVT